MNKGQIVLRHRDGLHYYGVVLSSEVGEDAWRSYTIRWITNSTPPTETEVCRQDELFFVNPIKEHIDLQKATILSSAIASPNFAKILKEEGFLEGFLDNE